MIQIWCKSSANFPKPLKLPQHASKGYSSAIYLHQICTTKIIKTRLKPTKTGFILGKGHKKSSYFNCNCLIFSRAASEVRTRDPQLGKLMLYQLSYCRKLFHNAML